MPRLKVRNLGYLLVATVCLLLYYNALVPSKNYDNNNSDELVDRWIEKKLDVVLERDKTKDNSTKVEKRRAASEAVKSPEEVAKKETQMKANSSNKKKEETENKKSTNKENVAKKETAAQPQQKKERNAAWMRRMQQVQSKRKAHLRKICETLKRPPKSMDELAAHPKQLRALIVNDRYKFIYSIVYKVGSTNWERVIVETLKVSRMYPIKSFTVTRRSVGCRDSLRTKHGRAGKLEDADDDIPFVLTRIGIQNRTLYGSTSMKKKGSDERLWAPYYSQVPKDVMKRFYEIYRPDFTLFGYEMPASFSGQ
ncbi:putative carbohydrate sulfotransferase 14-like isoform X2 [Apostichopus japonicus]|uniref:Carbohydrate sulfotransferase n=1 Tax=Stichopus japonicus TaxID=307972 RepID=A0A2G8KA21_STIJA|nr:putative carbohydrate sulfotransferase 14-like isoform X2 [Apostichopus japonicus]